MHSERLAPQAELPEHFPTIITEVAACEGIDEIDINLWRVVERLMAGGLTPEQIDETTIVLSAKKIGYGTVVTSGRYLPETKTVLIFPVLNTRWLTKRYREAKSDEQIDKEYRRGGESMGWRLDWALQHELEHRIIHAEGGMPEEMKHTAKRDRKMAAVSFGALPAAITSIGVKEAYLPSHSALELGVTALTLCGTLVAAACKANTTIARNAYRKSPEESRACAAESNDAADSLFTVRLAFQNQPIREVD